MSKVALMTVMGQHQATRLSPSDVPSADTESEQTCPHSETASRRATRRVLIQDRSRMFREGVQLLLPSMTAMQAVEVVVDGDALVGACAAGGFDAVVFETVDVAWNVDEMLRDVRRLLRQPVLIGTYPSQHHRPGPVDGVALVCRTGSCRAVARALDGLPAAEFNGTKANPAPLSYESYPLTRREFQVLALISGGSTTAQIADRLGLSAKTVESRMQSLYSKLNVQNRSSAIAVAMGSGLLGVGPSAHGAP